MNTSSISLGLMIGNAARAFNDAEKLETQAVNALVAWHDAEVKTADNPYDVWEAGRKQAVADMRADGMGEAAADKAWQRAVTKSQLKKPAAPSKAAADKAGKRAELAAIIADPVEVAAAEARVKAADVSKVATDKAAAKAFAADVAIVRAAAEAANKAADAEKRERERERSKAAKERLADAAKDADTLAYLVWCLENRERVAAKLIDPPKRQPAARTAAK